MLKQARLLITILICFCSASVVSAYASAHEIEHQHADEACLLCELGEQGLDDDAAISPDLNRRLVIWPDVTEIHDGRALNVSAIMVFQSRGPPVQIS